jgi:hypothetical protein
METSLGPWRTVCVFEEHTLSFLRLTWSLENPSSPDFSCLIDFREGRGLFISSLSSVDVFIILIFITYLFCRTGV